MGRGVEGHLGVGKAEIVLAGERRQDELGLVLGFAPHRAGIDGSLPAFVARRPFIDELVGDVATGVPAGHPEGRGPGVWIDGRLCGLHPGSVGLADSQLDARPVGRPDGRQLGRHLHHIAAEGVLGEENRTESALLVDLGLGSGDLPAAEPGRRPVLGSRQVRQVADQGQIAGQGGRIEIGLLDPGYHGAVGDIARLQGGGTAGTCRLQGQDQVQSAGQTGPHRFAHGLLLQRFEIADEEIAVHGDSDVKALAVQGGVAVVVEFGPGPDAEADPVAVF